MIDYCQEVRGVIDTLEASSLTLEDIRGLIVLSPKALSCITYGGELDRVHAHWKELDADAPLYGVDDYARWCACESLAVALTHDCTDRMAHA